MCYTVGGILGSLLGGVSSDKLVKRLGVSARAVVLAVGQIIATPFSIAMFYIDPPWVFIPQAIGYLFGAMWFGAMFTILVEVTPPKIRSTAFGVAFFIMENFGGNFPVIVHNLSELLDYRLALLIMYPGELILSMDTIKIFLNIISKCAYNYDLILFRCCILLPDLLTTSTPR